VLFTAERTLGSREVSLRVAAPDEVVVSTRYSSISAGTEKLIFNGKLPGFPMLRYPLVPGYESAGVVERVGPEVHGVAVGDEVFVGGSMCYTDAAGVFGGNASRLIKKGSAVVPLRGLSLAQAPLLALAATSLHGVLRLGDVRGKRVLVLGLGAIGQLAAQFLANAGARVIAVDRSADRVASLAGDARIETFGSVDDLAVIDAVDVAVEATGNPELIASCARLVRSGGSIVLLSYYDRLQTDYVDLFVKEITLLVAREWAHDDLLAARDAAASGLIDLAPLAGYVVPVGEYERAYQTAFDDPSVLKVILQWA
jgi:3-hydroxyethyl bacteriochlorophyllide a dehydrogenase